jgi:hypothetical protein
MKKEELLKALTIAERLKPDSDIARKLRKKVEADDEFEMKKKYMEMLTKNEFQSRTAVENLRVSFKDDLLFMYDMTHFMPSSAEKKDYEDLKELFDFIENNMELSAAKEKVMGDLMEDIILYDFKVRLSNESWHEVLDTFAEDEKKTYVNFKNIFEKFQKLFYQFICRHRWVQIAF